MQKVMFQGGFPQTRHLQNLNTQRDATIRFPDRIFINKGISCQTFGGDKTTLIHAAGCITQTQKLVNTIVCDTVMFGTVCVCTPACVCVCVHSSLISTCERFCMLLHIHDTGLHLSE